MTFLNADQLAALTINRMVFHVVGNGTDPVYLREAAVSSIGPFFVSRISSGNTGIMLDFHPKSSTAAALHRIHVYKDRFNRESRRLAKLFHNQHSGMTTEGLFMLFELSCLSETLFAILKYDQQEVVRFAIRQDAKGRKRISLKALETTLVKTPDALQKSAIIRLATDGTGGEACVRDRSAGGSITRYFQRFLGARRRYSNASLTSLLQKATRTVAKECREQIAPPILRNINERIYEALATNGSFDPQQPSAYLGSVFGPVDANTTIINSFEKELRRNRIDGESFVFDASELPKPRRRRLTTIEGITVTFDQQYENRVAVKKTVGGGSQIVIDTDGLEENDYSE